MSGGVNYSKWDKMDYGSSSDDENEGMESEAQPRVTTLDGPSSVTFGGGADTVTAQSGTSGGDSSMFAQAAKVQQSKNQSQEEEWTSNGSNIGDKLYWCQDRYSVTMRQQVPGGVQSKDISVKLKGALPYRDRHNAVVSARTEAKTPSLVIQVQGIPILAGDMPYPCHLEEDHEEGEEHIDWTLEMFEANKAHKFITMTFFKAVPMEGVTLWWNKPLNHMPEIDITKCEGRTKGKSTFQQNFKEAEERFKAQLQQQQQQPPASAAAAAPPNPKQVHKLVTKRYKALRKEGIDLKEAMVIARREYGLDQMDNMDVGTQVATMFGMPM